MQRTTTTTTTMRNGAPNTRPASCSDVFCSACEAALPMREMALRFFQKSFVEVRRITPRHFSRPSKLPEPSRSGHSVPGPTAWPLQEQTECSYHPNPSAVSRIQPLRVVTSSKLTVLLIQWARNYELITRLLVTNHVHCLRTNRQTNCRLHGKKCCAGVRTAVTVVRSFFRQQANSCKQTRNVRFLGSAC